MNILTHRYTLPALLLATVIVFWLFTAFPQWDLALARLYYVDGRFVADRGGWVHQLRMLFWNLSLLVFIAAVLAVSLAHSYVWPQRLLPVREWNVILWGFLLGPGILVNVILKGFSQRARPSDLLSFGGDRFYTSIGQFAGQCARDCSFVSGEVSGTTAFCLSCLIILRRHQARLGRKIMALLYALLALIFAFVFAHRVLSGGHFLSDALLGALLTALVFVFVAALWPAQPESRPAP